MLQAIRSKAGSLIVKILFALLIVSFGVWGIGDIFRERSAAETTVASVGDINIQADELQNAVRNEMARMNSLFGGNFGAEQAKQLGLVDSVLNRIVGSDLLDLEERRLRLLVDDQVVRGAIMANPTFRNSAGVFDRNIFVNVLAANQLSEDRYVSLLRREIARGNLTGAVAGGAVAPTQLIDPLYRTRNEKRVADTVLVASDKVTDIAEPAASRCPKTSCAMNTRPDSTSFRRRTGASSSRFSSAKKPRRKKPRRSSRRARTSPRWPKTSPIRAGMRSRSAG